MIQLLHSHCRRRTGAVEMEVAGYRVLGSRNSEKKQTGGLETNIRARKKTEQVLKGRTPPGNRARAM